MRRLVQCRGAVIRPSFHGAASVAASSRCVATASLPGSANVDWDSVEEGLAAVRLAGTRTGLNVVAFSGGVDRCVNFSVATWFRHFTNSIWPPLVQLPSCKASTDGISNKQFCLYRVVCCPPQVATETCAGSCRNRWGRFARGGYKGERRSGHTPCGGTQS